MLSALMNLITALPTNWSHNIQLVLGAIQLLSLLNKSYGIKEMRVQCSVKGHMLNRHKVLCLIPGRDISSSFLGSLRARASSPEDCHRSRNVGLVVWYTPVILVLGRLM